MADKKGEGSPSVVPNTRISATSSRISNLAARFQQPTDSPPPGRRPPAIPDKKQDPPRKLSTEFGSSNNSNNSGSSNVNVTLSASTSTNTNTTNNNSNNNNNNSNGKPILTTTTTTATTSQPSVTVTTTATTTTTTATTDKTDDNSPSPEQKEVLSQRDKIIREILETEKTYVKNLGILVNVFLNPLVAMLKSGKRRILKDVYIKSIFSNLEQMYSINSELLNNLQTSTVGESFYKMGPFLKAYTTYVNNYNAGYQTYQNCLKRKPKFAVFLKEQTDNGLTGGLHFKSFLIMPIQRIPRYKMLLEDLLRNTTPTHTEYNLIEKSLTNISDIAAFVNERKREEENKQVLFDLSKELEGRYTAFIQPYRKYVRDSPNVFVSCRTLVFLKEKFTAYLFSDLILLTHSVNGSNLHFIYLTFAKLSESPDMSTTNEFSITCIEKGIKVSFTLHFVDTDECLSWHAEVKNCIQRLNRANIQKGLTTLGETEDLRIGVSHSLHENVYQYKNVKKNLLNQTQNARSLSAQLKQHQEELKQLLEIIEKETRELEMYERELSKVEAEEHRLYDLIDKQKSQVSDFDEVLSNALNFEQCAFSEVFGELPQIAKANESIDAEVEAADKHTGFKLNFFKKKSPLEIVAPESPRSYNKRMSMDHCDSPKNTPPTSSSSFPGLSIGIDTPQSTSSTSTPTGTSASSTDPSPGSYHNKPLPRLPTTPCSPQLKHLQGNSDSYRRCSTGSIPNGYDPRTPPLSPQLASQTLNRPLPQKPLPPVPNSNSNNNNNSRIKSSPLH